MNEDDFKAELLKVANQIEAALKSELMDDIRGQNGEGLAERNAGRTEGSAGQSAAELMQAMRAASLEGGKRIRPFLVEASASLFQPERQLVQDTSLAVELMHCYSLVHDDLPAMDNDELRRGQPTIWKAHGEATAILTGDALQSLAFELITRNAHTGNALMKAELAANLARAVGKAGMVSGQMRDLAAEAAEGEVSFADVIVIHAQKTGALISFAAEAGAIIGGADHHARSALKLYGEKLGLAFQLKDDLLDCEGNEADLGKTPGKDAASGKATLVAALGREKAERFLNNLADGANYALEIFGERAAPLRQLVTFVCARKG